MTNDPIADLLTRIRNAQMRTKDLVLVPASKMTTAIVAILKQEGFISDFKETESESAHKTLEIVLKYENGRPVMTNLKRKSKPGLREYVKYQEIKPVLNGLGISIISTPKGVMTGKQAIAAKVGGEYLCEIW